MKLYCVRHGQTFHNSEGRIQGQTDSQLSPLGERQCRAVAEALVNRDIEAVFASPLTRALRSAQCVADMLQRPLIVEPRLMELNAGVFQGLGWSEIDVKLPAEAARWRSHDPDYRIPGGESRRDLMNRAAAAFHAIREQGHQCVAVVAHGGSLSAAFKALMEIPPRLSPFSLSNASISIVDWGDEFKLSSLNETAHLQGLVSTSGEL